jgi:hypothetical protein
MDIATRCSHRFANANFTYAGICISQHDVHDANAYLVNEQGIDASRIVVATGTGDDQNVQNYLQPAGATFAGGAPGITVADETTVKPEGRKPLPERHRKMAIAKQGQ